ADVVGSGMSCSLAAAGRGVADFAQGRQEATPWNFVSSRQEKIDAAKEAWRQERPFAALSTRASPPTRVSSRTCRSLARRRARPGRGRRGRTLRRPRPPGPQPDRRREGPRPTPPRGWRARAIRRVSSVLAEAAMEGRLPRGFCVKRLTDLPMLWSEQWRAIGLQTPTQVQR